MSNREFENAHRHFANMLYWRNNVRDWSKMYFDPDIEKMFHHWMLAMSRARSAKTSEQKAQWLEAAAGYRYTISILSFANRYGRF